MGKRESHRRVTRAKLYILWGMICKRKINLTLCLIGHFSKVAKTKKGDTNIGGFITPIAFMIKNDFESHVLAVGHTLIGKITIKSIEIIEDKKGKFKLCLPNGSTNAFPSPHPSHLQIKIIG